MILSWCFDSIALSPPRPAMAPGWRGRSAHGERIDTTALFADEVQSDLEGLFEREALRAIILSAVTFRALLVDGRSADSAENAQELLW